MNQPDKNKNTIQIFNSTYFIIILAIMLLFIANMFTSMASSSTDKKYNSINIEKVNTTETWSIGSIDKVYTVDNKIAYDVYFYNIGDTIECRIPSIMFNKLNEEAKYDIDVEYSYVEEVYEDYYNYHKEEYDSIDDAVTNIPSNAREITGVTFIFDDYVTSGVMSNDEAELNFNDIYLNNDNTD